MEQIDLLLQQLQSYELREDLISAGKEINEIKIQFEDYLIEAERRHQVESIEAKENGEAVEPVDFAALRKPFLELYRTLVDKRKQQISLKETLEKENLKLKKGLIDDLKKIIESEENIGAAFNAYKSIHDTWKKVGDIPREYRDDVQKEYSRLLEIFFYTMRIYREIKGHDYKRNLQNKQVVLHKLQQLRNEEQDIKVIEQQLRVLQDEWEEIGPVQNEEWEGLKVKYWEIVRQIYDKINQHYEAQRQVYEQNIEAKKVLIQELNTLLETAQHLTAYREWDALIEKVKEIQEAYKKIGPGARKDNDLVWKQFRAASDAIFELKRSKAKEQQDVFSKRIDAKKQLILEAATLATTTQWKEATQRIIKLQKEWKEAGNTGRAENKLWTEFRAACDAFFSAKDADQAQQNKVFEDNYEAKLAIIAQIQGLEVNDKTEGLAQVRSLSAAFSEIGHVPMAKKDEVYNSYKSALDAAYGKLNLNHKERDKLAFKAKVDQLLNAPDRDKQVQRERNEIRKQVERLEQEMHRMENNLAFFARSKGADALRAEVDQKIKSLKDQVENYKQQLKLLPNE
ncbi:MAG: DUF349 domain-containing protein [Flavobacteriia bacterium]|nr:DUF349 domain-containing protein [Flavobacteriia bacterium]